MDETFTTVGSYQTAIEAHAAKNLLEANGIQAFVADEQTATQGWSNFLETKVDVAGAHAARAKQLLATAQR
jgi:hypothetical protein